MEPAAVYGVTKFMGGLGSLGHHSGFDDIQLVKNKKMFDVSFKE